MQHYAHWIIFKSPVVSVFIPLLEIYINWRLGISAVRHDFAPDIVHAGKFSRNSCDDHHRCISRSRRECTVSWTIGVSLRLLSVVILVIREYNNNIRFIPTETFTLLSFEFVRNVIIACWTSKWTWSFCSQYYVFKRGHTFTRLATHVYPVKASAFQLRKWRFHEVHLSTPLHFLYQHFLVLKRLFRLMQIRTKSIRQTVFILMSQSTFWRPVLIK